MRDALSLLEQAIAHGALDATSVAELFGGTGFELRMRLLDAIAAEDVPGALVALGELLDAGHDPRRVTEDLLVTCRDAFLLTSAKGRVRVDAPADQLERLHAFGDQLGQGLLVRAMETLGQAVVDMRGTDAADPRLVLEIGLVRLARRDAGPPLQVLLERIERLERASDGNGATRDATERSAPAPRPAASSPRPTPAVAAQAPESRPARNLGAIRAERAASDPAATGPAPQLTDQPAPVVDPSPVATPPPDAAPVSSSTPVDVDLDDVVVVWAEILTSLPPATKAAASSAQPIGLDEGIVTFGVPPAQMASAAPRFKKEADTIRDALSERLGTTLKFKLVPHEGFAASASASPPTRQTSSSPAASGPVAAPPSDEPPIGEAPPDLEGNVDDDLNHVETGNRDDFADLVDHDAPDAPHAAVDSVAKFTQSFDATVVEELPRD